MNSIENRLKAGINDFFLTINRDADTPVLIGFSGGADSLCLAILLWEERAALGIRPALAYLDHGIRAKEEREEEGRRIAKFADRMGIRLHRGDLRPGELKEEACRKGLSLEEAARDKRFDFFYSLMAAEGYKYLALGHHQDDQMETLIMRFFQGSGISGLRGIKPVNGFVLRPLLDYRKDDILSFLSGRGEEWISDPSNMENEFLRNKVRNRLVSEIESVFPGYRRSLKSFSEKMAETGRFINSETENRLSWKTDVDKGEGFYSIDAKIFFNTPRILVIQSLFELYNKTYPSRRRMPYRFLDSLIGDGRGRVAKKNDGTLLEGCGITLKVNKSRVFWSRDIVFPIKNSYLILVNSKCSFKISEYDFKIERKRKGDISETGAYIRVKETTQPLLFRSRLAGDQIRLPEGKKSLKKLYNGWGIEEADRWKIPVISDRVRILGVIASPWGGYNRFSEDLRVIKKTDEDECFFFSWSIRE